MLRDDELLFNDGSPDIRKLYAWVAEEETGIESVIAVPTSTGVAPLISTDERRAAKWQPWAQTAARARHKPARLIRFRADEEILWVGP